MKEIKFISTQIALFFAAPIDRPEIYISDLVKEMGDIFDQSPLSIPVPNLPQFSDNPVVQLPQVTGYTPVVLQNEERITITTVQIEKDSIHSRKLKKFFWKMLKNILNSFRQRQKLIELVF